MTDNLLETGLMLTLYGMGTVFVFLLLLIAATRAMSRVALELDRRKNVPVSAAQDNAASGREPSPGPTELTAAISVAVRQFRKSRTTN